MERKIELVVFDWAGTTVDYASMAPADVFKKVFDRAGIVLSREEINGPMGKEKKEHIRQLLSLETAKDQWSKKYGREWNESDVDELYETFEATLKEVVADYSKPIDGVIETVDLLRKSGIKIGSTTGYNSMIMESVKEKAAGYGYVPDCIITPDITGKGRPAPYMLFEAMRELKVIDVKSVVKVGDTIADIKEGKNAGAWAIGILKGSNLMGVTEDEYKKLDDSAINDLKNTTTDKYSKAGADMVIDSIRDLPKAIERINERMAAENE